MGAMIDISACADSCGGEVQGDVIERSYWVKPERPNELSREGLLSRTFQEYMQFTHNQRVMVSIRERELDGVLGLLKEYESMTTLQALERLRGEPVELKWSV